MQSYANPQSLNRYSYVTNNPLRFTDPTGHIRVEDVGGSHGSVNCSKYSQYCNNGKPKSKDELKGMYDKVQEEKRSKTTVTFTPLLFATVTPIPTSTSMATNLMTVPAQCTSGSPCIGNFVPSATPSPTSTPYNVVATAGASLANTAGESFRNNCLVPSLGFSCGHALQDMGILRDGYGDAIDAAVYTADEISNRGSSPPTQREKIDSATIGGLSALELTTALISMFFVP